MISVFRRGVNEICDLQGFETAQIGNSLPTFRECLLVRFSKVKQPLDP